MMHKKTIYASLEVQALKGEKALEGIFHWEPQVKFYEEYATPREPEEFRSDFLLGNLKTLNEKLNSFSIEEKNEKRLYRYYNQLLSSIKLNSNEIISRKMFEKPYHYLNLWALVDAGRLLLFMKKPVDALKVFKAALAQKETDFTADHVIVFKLISMAFDQLDQSKSAFRFLNEYLYYRKAAITYLHESYLTLLEKVLSDKKVGSKEYGNQLIQSYKILGPDYGQKVIDLYKSSKDEILKSIPEMEMTLMRIKKKYELDMVDQHSGWEMEPFIKMIEDYLKSTPQLPNN